MILRFGKLVAAPKSKFKIKIRGSSQNGSLCQMGRGPYGVMKLFPHSTQAALDLGVIKPQAGHILCDAYPAICGFTYRILKTHAATNTIASRLTPMAMVFISLNDALISESGDVHNCSLLKISSPGGCRGVESKSGIALV